MTGYAWVTGGASGIGAATCRMLAQQGWRIAVVDRNGAGAEAVRASLPGQGHTAHACDVTDEAQVERAFDAAETTGPVNALVTCAGGTLNTTDRRPRIWETSLEEWNTTEALNSRSTFLSIRAFLRRRMAKPVTNGRIVTIASAAARRGGPAAGVAYAAHKGAVVSLTKAVAVEIASTGITANSICPGPFDTPALHTTNNAGHLEAMLKGVPLQRVGQPEEIGNAVAYLLSPGAGFVTGVTLDVNGGSYMA